MLTQLSIKNYALIEHLEIQFSNQFSTITGETGAGKSILLGALGLVLGKRADLSSLKNNEQKCFVEAQFNIKNYNLKSFFLENDIDFEENTIIRREILPTGKSRAFINDSPVNLNELQQLGNLLLDIHSQHQTLELADEKYQTEILDAVGNNFENLAFYKSKIKEYKKIKAELERLQSEKSEFEKETDYNQFLFDELEKANLIENEQNDLEIEFEKLSNIDFLKESFQKVYETATNEQMGIISLFNDSKNVLQKTASFSNNYLDLSNRLNSIIIEFTDISNEIDLQNEKLIPDPEKWEQLNNKLQIIYQLQKKHQVNSVQELIEIRNNLSNLLLQTLNIDTKIETLKVEFANTKEELLKIAYQISDNRKKTAPILAHKIVNIVTQLGMSHAQFSFEITQMQSFLPNGIDNVQMLFSANKGGSFGLLKKVASGGEMSRIMLAVKAILAQYTKLPTLIFDEIDTGVSGEVAQNMAQIMQNMSKNMQIFAITHLPQIAAKGKSHFKVFKQTNLESTVTEIKQLSEIERINEIAEMISGKNPSQSAMDHAKSLLN